MKETNKNVKIQKVIKIVMLAVIIGTIAFSVISCKWTVGLVRGSGDTEKVEREVHGFDEVYLTGVGNLIIDQGDEESLLIEADDNIIPLIETDVSGDRLTIGFKRGYNFIPNVKIKFHLTVIELDKISISGAGDIDCDDFNTDRLEFEISGAGDINFNIDADRVETKSSGAGDITLKGIVDSQEVNMSGAGRYNARELKSKECRIQISGAGSATVNVSESLDVNISGVGNVYYIGDPDIDKSISGLGRVKSID